MDIRHLMLILLIRSLGLSPKKRDRQDRRRNRYRRKAQEARKLEKLAPPPALTRKSWTHWQKKARKKRQLSFRLCFPLEGIQGRTISHYYFPLEGIQGRTISHYCFPLEGIQGRTISQHRFPLERIQGRIISQHCFPLEGMQGRISDTSLKMMFCMLFKFIEKIKIKKNIKHSMYLLNY